MAYCLGFYQQLIDIFTVLIMIVITSPQLMLIGCQLIQIREWNWLDSGGIILISICYVNVIVPIHTGIASKLV